MLSNKALLVHVSISQWTGRKFDRRATETVATQHATNTEAGNYTKKLLPGARELERVNTLTGQIRKFFYRESLPWMSDGARIIKSSAFTDFLAEFRKMKNEFDSAVNDFLNVYPALQVQARMSLGGLYSPEDYPDVLTLAKKFQCEVQVMPLPDVGDFRVEIGDGEKEKFIKRMEQVQKDAMADCWNRLYEVVNRAAEKLAQPDPVFKNSLIENISDMCKLLPRLNVTDDASLESKRQEIEAMVAKLNPETLRDSATERQDTAAKLAKITRDMGAFMGVTHE